MSQPDLGKIKWIESKPGYEGELRKSTIAGIQKGLSDNDILSEVNRYVPSDTPHAVISEYVRRIRNSLNPNLSKALQRVQSSKPLTAQIRDSIRMAQKEGATPEQIKGAGAHDLDIQEVYPETRPKARTSKELQSQIEGRREERALEAPSEKIPPGFSFGGEDEPEGGLGFAGTKAVYDWFRKNASRETAKEQAKNIERMQEKIARGESLSQDEERRVSFLREELGFDPVRQMSDPDAASNRIKSFVQKTFANLGSTNQVFERNPYTKPIADTITKAQDEGIAWKSQVLHTWDKVTGNASKKDIEQAWDILNSHRDPSTASRKNFSPGAIRVAKGIRVLLDSIYDELVDSGVKTKRGGKVGFINEYITHVKDATSGLDDIKNYVEALFRPLTKKPGKLEGLTVEAPTQESTYNRKIPTPEDPYLERRTGAEFEFEKDLRRLGRIYVEAARKVMFDKPAIIEAQKVMNRLPEGFYKNEARWYLKHFARMDEEGYSMFMNQLDRKLSGIGAGSVLFGNTKIQALHLARLVSQVWPEVGTTNSLYGLFKFVENPVKTVRTLRDNGLLQQQVTPLRMKTKMEALDFFGNYMDAGNTLAKAIGWNGFLRKAKGNVADAIKEMKRVEGMTDPARPSHFLEYFPRTVVQFKYWAQKYIENGFRATEDMYSEPNLSNLARLSRYAASVYILTELTKELGIHLYHLTPYVLELTSGATPAAFGRTLKFLMKGKYEDAAKELGTWSIRGGKSIPRELEDLSLKVKEPEK